MKQVLLLMLFLFAGLTAALAMHPAEQKKIDHLISSVENLQGAVFIRNGSEHEPGKAAEHLRYKLKRAGKRVKTVEDFITHIASKSSFSGKPYLIKFRDGTTVEAEGFFRDKLKDFRAKQ